MREFLQLLKVACVLLGVQNFLRGVFRDAVYPKDIWHRDATYPRIFCRGVPKIRGVEYPMTPVSYICT